MANTLLEALQQKLQQPLTQAPSNIDTASLLRTKLTGKAAPTTSTVPQAVPTAALQIGDQSRAALGQLQQEQRVQGEQQSQQLADQTQAAGIKRQEYLQDADSKKQQFNQQSQDILNSYERGEKQIRSNQDVAELEQVGFNLRLNNQKYVQDLLQNASRERLDDDQVFKQKMYESVFSNRADLLNNDLAFVKIMDTSDREFREHLASIDIDQAVQIASNEGRAAQVAGTAQGVGGLMSGAGQVVAAVGNQQQADATANQKAQQEAYMSKTYGADSKQYQEWKLGLRYS